MLTPGTTTWVEALPAVAASLLVLLVPGTGVALLLRARAGLALAIGPAVSTTLVVVAGSACAALGVAWGAVPLVAVTLLAWLLTWAVRRLAPLRRWPALSVEPPSRPGDGPRWAQALGVGAGVAAAALVVTWVLVRSAGTPDQFPQHPDTIFHLGVTQWMAASHDVSFQHGLRFTGAATNAGYPVGFHAVGATVSILTGLPAVVSLMALVLVLSALVWPLGMAVLGRTVFGARPASGAVTAVTSVLFVAYPFMLMVFGTIWPNLFGQALLPGVLAAAVTLTHRIAPVAAPASAQGPTALVLLLAVPGLAVAHPNALITAVVLAAACTVLATARRAWGPPEPAPSPLPEPAPSQAAPSRPAPSPVARWAPLAAALAATVVGIAASVVIRPQGMFLTGAPGPEMSVRRALVDLAGFAPRSAVPAYVLGALVLVGVVVVLACYRSALWLVPVAAAFSLLYFLNTAVDTPTARLLTWPWYNNAIRLAAVAVVPAALLAAAAVLGPSRWVARRAHRGWVAEGLVAALVLGVVVVPNSAFAGRDVRWVSPYFAPDVAHSWASPEELRALRELARHVPPDGVVAADPWKGGTYMYVVAGTRMFWPTEKTNTTPQRRLLGLRLGDVASDPEVCRAVQEAGITHALVGGVPFLWGQKRSEREFVGVEAVRTSPGWEKVATSGPYTLYRLAACAGS